MPEGWAWCRLGVLSETTDYIANGSFADTKANVKFYKDKNYALLVKTQDFNNNFTEDLTYTDEKGYNFLSKSHLLGGELLLSNIGASIGKALIVPKFDIPMAVAPNSIVVRTTDLLETQFLKSIMLSTYGQNALVAFTAGSAMPKFNKTQLRSLLIPLPTISAQQSIISTINTIFETIQVIENDKGELENLIKHAKSKILDLAIHGKLVPQDPSDESAEELLKRIATSDNRPYEKVVEEPFEIPSTWEWVKLGDIGQTNIGLTYHPNDVSNSGITVLRSNNIQNDKLCFDDVVKVNNNTKILNNQYINNGDILICARNGSQSLVGKCVLIDNLREKTSFGAFMAVFRSHYNQYILKYLQSKYFKDYMFESNSTQIHQLTQSMLKDALIPFPPEKEQTRIVAKVDELYSHLDKIQNDLV